MPCTPIALSASRTSSSLNGLTIAVTIFMRPSRSRRRHGPLRGPCPVGLHRFAQRDDQAALVGVAPDVLLVGADSPTTDRETLAEVVRDAELVVGVVDRPLVGAGTEERVVRIAL